MFVDSETWPDFHQQGSEKMTELHFLGELPLRLKHYCYNCWWVQRVPTIVSAWNRVHSVHQHVFISYVRVDTRGQRCEVSQIRKQQGCLKHTHTRTHTFSFFTAFPLVSALLQKRCHKEKSVSWRQHFKLPSTQSFIFTIYCTSCWAKRPIYKTWY